MAYSSKDADFDALFDLDQDADCRTNLYNSDPRLREQSIARLMAAMRSIGVPKEHYVRLGL
jgi:hypothetical protein